MKLKSFCAFAMCSFRPEVAITNTHIDLYTIMQLQNQAISRLTYCNRFFIHGSKEVLLQLKIMASEAGEHIHHRCMYIMSASGVASS